MIVQLTVLYACHQGPRPSASTVRMPTTANMATRPLYSSPSNCTLVRSQVTLRSTADSACNCSAVLETDGQRQAPYQPADAALRAVRLVRRVSPGCTQPQRVKTSVAGCKGARVDKEKTGQHDFKQATLQSSAHIARLGRQLDLRRLPSRYSGGSKLLNGNLRKTTDT